MYLDSEMYFITIKLIIYFTVINYYKEEANSHGIYLPRNEGI